MEHSFKPIVFKSTQTLILGSFPSIESVKNNFYYAHPRNQFWKILSSVTKYPINNVDQKIWLLKESNIGLWDMVKSCSRDNSLDVNIYNEEVNDIPNLLEQYSNISKILFTGRKAQELYMSNFSYLDIQTDYLPSPSSAYAKMSIEEKIEAYREKI